MSSKKSAPRALVTTVLAAAAVGSMVLSGCEGTTSTGAATSQTPQPSPSAGASAPAGTAGTAAARAIIDAADAHSFDSSVDGRGDLLTIWSSGHHYARPTALGIREKAGGQALALGAPRAHVLAALPDGWLLRGDDGLLRLDSHGNTYPVTERHGRSVTPHPGDVAYSLGSDTSLYRPGTSTIYALGRLLGRVNGHGAVISSDGTLMTLVGQDETVAAARLRDGQWSYTTLDEGAGVAAGEIAGSGQRLIAATTYHPRPLGDGVEDPVHRVAVSTDAGAHWHSARVPVGQSVVLSMAVTRSGTGFVSIGAPRGPCSLLRVTRDATASCVKVPTIQVLAHGDRVYSTFFRGRRLPYRLQISDDQGDTWRTIAVPGRS